MDRIRLVDRGPGGAGRPALTRFVRPTLVAAYVFYLVCVAYLVWLPAPAGPGSATVWLSRVMTDLGLPLSSQYWSEKWLNVVMFVPLSMMGALLWRAPGLAAALLRWGLVGLAGTCLIESVQWACLPTRVASLSDVVTNTSGGVLGVLLVWPVASNPCVRGWLSSDS